MDKISGVRLITRSKRSAVRHQASRFLSIACITITAFSAVAETTATEPAAAAAAPLTTYTNPLNVPIADPFVLREGDTYYMYGTTDYGGAGFLVFTSPDLVRWTRAGVCYRPKSGSWGSHHFWAPEVIKRDSTYYLHYTARNSSENRRNILIAKSDSPLGPFEDYAGPLFPDQSVIDSHIYHDEAADQYYIYASPENEPPSKILGAEFSPDFTRLLTTPTVCLLSDFGWEDLWIEAPIIHKHKDTLYMIYSGGAFWEADYALGYATAKSPLGPWTKSATNPLLKKTADVEGPGHNGLATSPDGSELFVIYHCHAGPWTINRMAAIDRLTFDTATSGPDVLRAPNAPTSTPQPLPAGAAPLKTIRSDEFTSAGLDLDQWEIFSNESRDWEVRDGQLVIRAGDADLWRGQLGGRNVFLQRLPENLGDFAIETSLTMNARRPNEQAFLTLWQDMDNYVTFAASIQAGRQPQFVTTVERWGKANASVAPNNLGWPVCLRIEKRGTTLKVYASDDGQTWHPAVRDQDISDRTFTHAGLGAWSPGIDNQTPAYFDWFRIEWLANPQANSPTTHSPAQP